MDLIKQGSAPSSLWWYITNNQNGTWHAGIIQTSPRLSIKENWKILWKIIFMLSNLKYLGHKIGFKVCKSIQPKSTHFQLRRRKSIWLEKVHWFKSFGLAILLQVSCHYQTTVWLIFDNFNFPTTIELCLLFEIVELPYLQKLFYQHRKPSIAFFSEYIPFHLV